MEGLLHWDFSPGVALADQVRRRFGSTVHFSPSRGAKEFFLVVSFSSAPFSLNEDSVAITLQCCLGGIINGFKVVRINNRSFRFSVANNKVGHFIYGLKDRIWPDFICHFHLFNGCFSKLSSLDKQWHADTELQELSARSPLAIKSKFNFSPQPQVLGKCSQAELQKFNLVPISSMDFSNLNATEASSSSRTNCSSQVHQVIQNSKVPLMAPPSQAVIGNLSNDLGLNSWNTNGVGYFESFCKLSMQEELEDRQTANHIQFGSFRYCRDVPYPSLPQCFLKSAYKHAPPHDLWPPTLSAAHKRDLAQAQYSDEEIITLANNWAALCAKCLQWGHKKIACPARIICIRCFGPGHKANSCKGKLIDTSNKSLTRDSQINQPDHTRAAPPLDRPRTRTQTV